ncbi:hypothetical protein [Nocardia sp. NPDC003963]
MHRAGEAGRFEPDPTHVPADDSTPTDPIDAVLRLIPRDEQPADILGRILVIEFDKLGRASSSRVDNRLDVSLDEL